MPRAIHRGRYAVPGGALLLILLVSRIGLAQAQPDVQTIIRRSVQANSADWMAEPDYECFEEDGVKHKMVTYDDKMISGSPYQELVAVDGHPLSPAKKMEEQRKLEQVIAERKKESAEERAKRIANYQRDRDRDHLLLDQLTMAFNFKLLSMDELQGHRVYLLEATPRPGYRPPGRRTEVLTGMQGKLWIDAATFQWVKVKAVVIHPVSIEGFLAKVEPGTSFELDKSPVDGDIWLADHFSVHSSAKVLSLIPYKNNQEQRYYGCKKIAQTQETLSSK